MRYAYVSYRGVSGSNGTFAPEPQPLTPAEFATIDMPAFDRLGPLARDALARSRFGGSADLIQRRYGGPFADDEAVARRIRADDDKFSGQFGPPAAEGI